jgi:hypothetical protein
VVGGSDGCGIDENGCIPEKEQPRSKIPWATHAWAKSSKANRKHGHSFFGVYPFSLIL